MVMLAEDLASRETWLTQRICDNLYRHHILFECQVACRFDQYDWGYIDIFVKSSPPSIIEVKGASSPSFLYRAIGQLLLYSTCFQTAKLYLATPPGQLVAPQIVSVLDRVGIGQWTAVSENYALPFDGMFMTTHSSCKVCMHKFRRDIEQDLRDSLNFGSIRSYWGIHHASLYQHQRRHMINEAAPLIDDKPLAVDIDLAQRQMPLMPSIPLTFESDPPLARLQQAWQDAKNDPLERGRMVHWLNEQLQADEMGLS